MKEIAFDFNKLLQESIQIIKEPKVFFTSLKKTGGFVEPTIKSAVYGVAVGVIGFILNVLHLSAMPLGMFPGAGIGILISAPIIAILGLFVCVVIGLIIAALCKGNTDFETHTRVFASLQVMLPIAALLNFSYGINLYLGVLVSLVVSLLGLWLFFHALTTALAINEHNAKIVVVIFGVLILLSTINNFNAYRRVSAWENITRDYQAVIEKNIKE